MRAMTLSCLLYKMDVWYERKREYKDQKRTEKK